MSAAFADAFTLGVALAGRIPEIGTSSETSCFSGHSHRGFRKLVLSAARRLLVVARQTANAEQRRQERQPENWGAPHDGQCIERAVRPLPAPQGGFSGILRWLGTRRSRYSSYWPTLRKLSHRARLGRGRRLFGERCQSVSWLKLCCSSSTATSRACLAAARAPAIDTKACSTP